MSIDRETLRLILQAEAEQRGLELRGNELVGAQPDLEAVIASAAQRLGCQLDPSLAPSGLIRHGRLDVERLASLLATLAVEVEEIEMEPSPVDFGVDAGLPGDDDSRIDDEEDLAGGDDSRID
jgi:hypothetical protein